MTAIKTRRLGVPPVLAGGRHVGDGEVAYERGVRVVSRLQFEAELAGWLARYVDRRSVVPLMAAANLTEILDFVTGSTPPLSGEWPVTMHLAWDRLSNGQWYVEGVWFTIRVSNARINQYNLAKLRQRMIDQAEERQRRKGPPEWRAYFNIEQGGPNWLEDAAQGQKMINGIMDEAHQAAREAVPVLENPIGVDFSKFDNATRWELAKTLIGAIAPAGGKRVSGVWDWFDRGEKAVTNMSERNLGKLAGDAMDVGLPLLFAEAGPVGGLGSVILGSFFNIAIASDAKRVAAARARLYYWFAVGFVGGLAPPPIDKPSAPARTSKATEVRLAFEEAMFGGAMDLGRKAGARGSYLLQLALIHYAATHDTTNAWNFAPGIQKNWKHPQDYTYYWSRELMVRSLVWQLSRMKYLTR